MTVNKARSYFPRGLFQPVGSFRFSMDALLLASFAVQCLKLDAQLAESSLSSPKNSLVSTHSMLDLGCGCGVVAFGVMLQVQNLQGCGVDVQPELLEASVKNARLLGLETRYSSICADVTIQNAPFSLPDKALGCSQGYAFKELTPNPQNATLDESAAKSQNGPFSESADIQQALAKERSQHFSLITANPPYRLYGSGRVPPSEMRSTALFGDQRNLDAFIRTAALNLHPTGSFCIVFPWKRRDELLQTLAAHSLIAKHKVTVFTRPNTQASLVLLQAKKQTGSVCVSPASATNRNRDILCKNAGLLPSQLTIHRAGPVTMEATQPVAEQGDSRPLQSQKGQNSFTDEAVRFCPYLLCNA